MNRCYHSYDHCCPTRTENYAEHAHCLPITLFDTATDSPVIGYGALLLEPSSSTAHTQTNVRGWGLADGVCGHRQRIDYPQTSSIAIYRGNYGTQDETQFRLYSSVPSSYHYTSTIDKGSTLSFSSNSIVTTVLDRVHNHTAGLSHPVDNSITPDDIWPVALWQRTTQSENFINQVISSDITGVEGLKIDSTNAYDAFPWNAHEASFSWNSAGINVEDPTTIAIDDHFHFDSASMQKAPRLRCVSLPDDALLNEKGEESSSGVLSDNVEAMLSSLNLNDAVTHENMSPSV